MNKLQKKTLQVSSVTIPLFFSNYTHSQELTGVCLDYQQKVHSYNQNLNSTIEEYAQVSENLIFFLFENFSDQNSDLNSLFNRNVSQDQLNTFDDYSLFNTYVSLFKSKIQDSQEEFVKHYFRLDTPRTFDITSQIIGDDSIKKVAYIFSNPGQFSSLQDIPRFIILKNKLENLVDSFAYYDDLESKLNQCITDSIRNSQRTPKGEVIQ